MNFSSLRILLLAGLVLWGVPVFAESVPGERRITHREQSLKRYNPYDAEELWKKIPIPPAPALSVEEALASFEVAEGFKVECVAAEPLVVDPVCFDFDADGRIWAAEFRGWMRDIDGAGEADPSGRIVVLEDTDGDTKMDKSTVFLDGLVMPRTISFVDGGVLVGEPPNLWYCQDTNGDLKCDKKVRVGDWGEPGNPEHTINGLMHAIDNWMYNAKSDLRHRFVDGKLIEEKTIFRGQWGMGQDDYGRLFYGYESSSLHGDLFPAEYVMRNPHVGSRSSFGMNYKVAAKAQEVYPIRVTPGITLGGTELREDGRLRTFTIVAGQTIYRGDQFPKEFYGHAVIPEAAGNLVRLDRFREGDGVMLETENAFGEVELLASRDERFRPIFSRVGPDGSVYVADLYRGIIEHVIFMMPYLKNQILSRGLDKPIGLGRIYRISHEGKELGEVPKMSAMNAAELAEHLSHANGWWRDTAQRLLVERGAVEAAGRLREIVAGDGTAAGKLHALWTLEGIGELDWETVSKAIGDGEAMVRSTAVRLSERFAGSEETWARLAEFFEDDRPMVRLQMLLTLGEWKGDRAEAQMARILKAHPSRVFGTAAVSGLGGRELEFAGRLAKDGEWTGVMESGTGVLRSLATGVANEGKAERVAALLAIADAGAETNASATASILQGVLASNLAKSRWPAPLELKEEPALFATLRGNSREEWKSSAGRLHRILTWPGDTHVHPKKPVAKPLSEEEEKRRMAGEAVYMATCFACHKATGRGLSGQAPPLANSEWVNGPADRLVKIALQGVHGPIRVNGREWNHHMPGMGNSPILNDERLAALLTYIRRAWDNYGDAVAPEEVAAVRAETAGRAMPWTAEELLNPEAFAKAAPAPAADPLEKYRAALGGGDVERGRKLFHANLNVRCNACHTVGRLGGGFIGPDLTEIGARGTAEYLLESLILPNATIVEGYETMVVRTTGGEFHSGTLVRDNREELVLAKLEGGEVAIPAGEVAERIASAASSMPPVGTIFSVEEVADLVAYLGSLKPEERSVAGANRLTYLDGDDPYYPSHLFPKLTTPMWVGEEGVEAVTVFSIDDMRAPDHKNNSAKYEAFLRPLIDRLKKIDGRAPVSIFTCTASPEDPVLKGLIEEGLSIEVHTVHHPCPLLRNGDLEWSKATVHDCIDMLGAVKGTRAVAYRAPCCDVFNTQSPLIFQEILGKPTAEGRFLTVDSSVHNIFTRADPEMPVELALDEEGRSRFRKYTTGAVPMAGRLNYKYMNYVENYPYPYLIGRNTWEIPCHVPGDHQEFFFEKLYGRRLLADWIAGMDAAAVKQGIMTLVFHPYGKCSPEELIALVDHAAENYPEKMKFLSIGEIEERLTKNLLGGHSLRAADGGDNGVRIMDVNADGFVDVIVANEKERMTRVWVPEDGSWKESGFPVTLRESGERFGVMDESGAATVIVRNEETSGAWSFDGGDWVERPELVAGLGDEVLFAEGGRDRGARLRDVDGDGRCELLLGNESRGAVFSFSEKGGKWVEAEYGMPGRARFVDAEGRDAGLRFADVDADGSEDVIFSDERGYAVHAWVSAEKGWSREVVAGAAGEGAVIPPIVVGGRSNGAVIHPGKIWYLNEHTDKLPSHSIRVELSRLGEGEK